jgi:hypothetical protein
VGKQTLLQKTKGDGRAHKAAADHRRFSVIDGHSEYSSLFSD